MIWVYSEHYGSGLVQEATLMEINDINMLCELFPEVIYFEAELVMADV